MKFMIDEGEKLEEERVEKKEKRKKERMFLRRVRREKNEILRVAEGLRGMEDRLRSAIDEVRRDVQSLRNLCESWFKHASASARPPSSPVPSPEPSAVFPTIDTTPLSTLEVTLVHPTPKKEKKKKVKYEESYPGKPLITSRQREIIEFVLTRFTERYATTIINKNS